MHPSGSLLVYTEARARWQRVGSGRYADRLPGLARACPDLHAHAHTNLSFSDQGNLTTYDLVGGLQLPCNMDVLITELAANNEHLRFFAIEMVTRLQRRL